MQRCSVTFTNLVNFYRHRKDIHISKKTDKRKSSKKIHKCPVCSKEFVKQAHLETSKVSQQRTTCMWNMQSEIFRTDHYEAHIKKCTG